MDDYADKKTVWVKGYTKPDGTKVKGHYRDVGSGTQGLTRKGVARAINRFRLGVSDKIDVRPKKWSAPVHKKAAASLYNFQAAIGSKRDSTWFRKEVKGKI